MRFITYLDRNFVPFEHVCFSVYHMLCGLQKLPQFLPTRVKRTHVFNNESFGYPDLDCQANYRNQIAKQIIG